MKPLTNLPDGNFWVVEIDNNRADVMQANNRWDKQLLSKLLKDGCVYLNRPDAQAHANKVNKKESFTLNEAFTGVQLSGGDAKKIAAVTKAADIDLKGLAEDVYGQLEDELLSVDEVLAMIKSPDADDMDDWSLDKAGYQKALKQALSLALYEFQDSKDESLTPYNKYGKVSLSTKRENQMKNEINKNDINPAHGITLAQIKVGDIFTDGYDFYKILGLNKSTAKIVQLAVKYKDDGTSNGVAGNSTGTIAPTSATKGSSKDVRMGTVRGHGNWPTTGFITGSGGYKRYATRWNGQPIGYDHYS